MASVVQTLTNPAVARYTARYTEMRDRLPGAAHGWVTDLREAALSKFTRDGLPTRRVETWKYTDLRSLQQAEFSPASQIEVAPSGIALQLIEGAFVAVFIDGRFAPELSRLSDLPAGLQITSLADALAAGDQALCTGLGTIADPDQPGFVALNAALMQDGAVCRVGDGVTVERPIQLVFATTDGAAAETHLRNLLMLGENSHATIYQSHVSLGPSTGFCDVVTEVSVGQGAGLRHITQQDQSISAWHVGLVAARLGRDASFDSFVLSSGARLSRNEIRVALDGEGADCRLNGIALVRGRQHCDNTTDVDHAKGHGHSSQIYKNVLDDRARSVFQGRIHVAPDAQKTDAHQMNRNLLLSRNAQADSKPELIIHADDVKCSHGATVGDLDQDALFYLQSRGIDPIMARNLMVRGFASEMIDDLPDDAIRAHLEAGITSWLDAMATAEAA
ncbi:MAG: Fe-S cluster assembly protein SufD [Rhodospirillaceae bacterium]|jgi:Fe-S cluster assembly protein SufD|nr:Fe-S cluster assembly protein SufD [Rhodospirillaceae bacterium]